jgi:hypothetical protein
MFKLRILILHCPSCLFVVHIRIGPFVTGAIESQTGEFRAGFWFPLALFAAGGALLLTVDMDKGKDEAIAYRDGQRARH